MEELAQKILIQLNSSRLYPSKNWKLTESLI